MNEEEEEKIIESLLGTLKKRTDSIKPRSALLQQALVLSERKSVWDRFGVLPRLVVATSAVFIILAVIGLGGSFRTKSPGTSTSVADEISALTQEKASIDTAQQDLDSFFESQQNIDSISIPTI